MLRFWHLGNPIKLPERSRHVEEHLDSKHEQTRASDAGRTCAGLQDSGSWQRAWRDSEMKAGI